MIARLCLAASPKTLGLSDPLTASGGRGGRAYPGVDATVRKPAAAQGARTPGPVRRQPTIIGGSEP